jgi:hypothetical protein
MTFFVKKKKSKGRKAKQVLSRGGYNWEEGKGIRKGCRWVNMVEKLCTHV